MTVKAGFPLTLPFFVPEPDIYRMKPGADLNREQLVKIKIRRLVYF